MDGTEVVRRPPFGDNPLVGERGANTQRRILDAALEVFARHGYHDTRVELITEAAGCSRPAFYQYFSSKDDVFWRLAAHMAKAMDALVADLDDIGADAAGVSRLRRWLDGLTDMCDTYAPILSSFQAASRDQARTAKGSQSVSERVGHAMLRDFDGTGTGPLPTASSTATVSVALRSIHYWRLGLGGLTRARFLNGLARTLHRQLHGPIAGVNVDPSTKAPAKAPPKWPMSPSSNGDPRSAAAQRSTDPPASPRRRERHPPDLRLPRHEGRRHRGGGRRLARQLLPVLRQQGPAVPGPGHRRRHADGRAPGRVPRAGRRRAHRMARAAGSARTGRTVGSSAPGRRSARSTLSWPSSPSASPPSPSIA